ncbi:unnamed protein product [Dicrocoelium dendriticum]|nr:unnamed protein product [Dicrocoelium dendriticum]
MVSVKSLYRTHDIPECAKQSLLERELFHSPSNAKLKHEVLSRELFVSEVQETLVSKQPRGQFMVTLLSDLSTVLNTFCPNEENKLFYVFAYNSESKRFMHALAEILIEDAFQAVIPNFRYPTPAHYRLVYSRSRFRCRKRGHLRHRCHRWYSTYLASRDKRDGRILGSRKSDDNIDPLVATEPLDQLPNKSPNPLLVSTAQPAERGSHPCSASPCAKTKSTDNAIGTDDLKSPPRLEIFGSTASVAGSSNGG